MTAGTGDTAEVKPKGHSAEPVHMGEPAAKIDTASGNLSTPPPLAQHAPSTKGTTHTENGVSQPVVESTGVEAETSESESAAAGQPAPPASPARRLSSEEVSGTPAVASTSPLTAPLSTPDLAAPPAAVSPTATPAAISSAGASQPSPASTMTASQPTPAPTMTAGQPAPADVSSPPALVPTPPALVSTPAAAPPAPPPAASPASIVSTGSSGSRKRSAESVGSAEPAARQPRRGSSERPSDAPVPHRTVEMIESSLHKLKREVKAIDLLARQKEREWDNLLRLRRAKEETFQRLRRKREVLLQQSVAEAASAAAATAVAQAPAASAPPPSAPRLASSAVVSAVPAHPVSSAMWALKQQQEQQRLQQQQRLAQQPPPYSPRGSVGLPRPLRPVPVPPFVSAAVSSAARLAQPARVAASEQEPQYREILAQVARLNQRLTGSADQAAADAAAASHSNLAKLLMEKKKMEPALLEMLKPQMTVRPSSNGPLQLRAVAPSPAAPRPPPPPPPPAAAAAEVPLCQGCGRRPAQFVCAGCGRQWYCSRDCQVEAWDSHADDCSG